MITRGIMAREITIHATDGAVFVVWPRIGSGISLRPVRAVLSNRVSDLSFRITASAVVNWENSTRDVLSVVIPFSQTRCIQHRGAICDTLHCLYTVYIFENFQNFGLLEKM